MPASHGGYQNYRGKALSFLAESGVAILKVDDFRHRWIRVTIQAAGGSVIHIIVLPVLPLALTMIPFEQKLYDTAVLIEIG
jgi:hypothetical protein